jgi:hypothetical protein
MSESKPGAAATSGFSIGCEELGVGDKRGLITLSYTFDAVAAGCEGACPPPESMGEGEKASVAEATGNICNSSPKIYYIYYSFILIIISNKTINKYK